MDKDLRAWAEAERARALEQVNNLTAPLPLKFLRQQAHFTTPASNYSLAEKAAARGYASVERLLRKYAITPADLGETLGVTTGAIETLLNADPHAPLVMLDGEDAQALDAEVVQRGRENAVRVLREADWGPTLRFYRPSGLQLPYCIEDMTTVLTEAGAGRTPGEYPVDGIIFPKMEHPAEADWVCGMLDKLETRMGLARNTIKLQVLVESGWAVANLPEIVQRAMPRLAGIIFGIADYAADLALPAIRFKHPVADWARAHVVNLAGAAGVPAIDAMTVNYPVADARLTERENRELLLARLKECFDDALHGIDLGMQGKWVGHPAQLFVVLLAYRTRVSAETVQAEVTKLLEYRRAAQEQLGATIIQGVMSDRATDRHTRARLRQAVAWGLVSPEDGVQLGVVTREEVA